MNNSFILFTDFWPGMQLLSREQRGDLLQALMAEYGADGCQQPNLDVPTQIVLAMMRPRMEDNRKKWEAEVQRRKDAAAKGGAAKAAKANASKHQSAEATASSPEATIATGSMPEHAVAGDSLPQQAEATDSMPEQVFLPVYDPDYDHDHDDLSKRSISSKTDAAAPPLSSDDASDEIETGETPATDTEAFPLPEHCPEHAALDDCPFARGQQEQSAPKPAPRKPKADLREKDWEAWYAAYPKHVGKAQAWKTWQAAVKSGELPDIDTLLAALKWQKSLEQWQVQQYIPNPGTYLNRQQWADEPPKEAPKVYGRMSTPIENREDDAVYFYNPDGSIDAYRTWGAGREAAMAERAAQMAREAQAAAR